MGKSNRIRSQRANAPIKAVNVKAKKKGMPSWLMTLLTIVITIAILLGVVVSLLNANGVFNRIRTSMSTDNFKVDANMMSYYFYTQYESFTQENSEYLEYGYYSLDSSKPLKDQAFAPAQSTESSTYYLDSMLITDSENIPATWFDYIMGETKKSVQNVLIYCEEANARGITLGEEEHAQIDASLSAIETYAQMYGYTKNAYVAAMYGTGVKESDVRKAMEYSSLATKCMTALSEDLEAGISDEDINYTYNTESLNYNVIDYSYYTFSVTFSDIVDKILEKEKADYSTATDEQKAKIFEEYKKQYNQALAKAEALKNLNKADTFADYIFNTTAKESFEDTYSAKTIADASKPSDSDAAIIKNALINDVLADIKADKIATDNAVTIAEGYAEKTIEVYGVDVAVDYAKIINEVKTAVFKEVLSAKSRYIVEKGVYTKDNEFSTWAFDKARKAGDMTTITSGDVTDGAIPEGKDSYTSISVSVYLLNKPQYRDAEKSRNVAYILYEKEDDAKAAITALKGNASLNYDAFEAYAHDNTNAGHAELDNYVAGTLGSDDFDAWLYAATAETALTAEPIKLDDSAYCVAYYNGEGDEVWHVTVKSALLNAAYEKYYTDMEAKYVVTVNQKALDAIDA